MGDQNLLCLLQPDIISMEFLFLHWKEWGQWCKCLHNPWYGCQHTEAIGGKESLCVHGCVYQPAAVNSPNSLLNANCASQVRLSFGTNIASEFNQFQLIQLRFFLYRRQSEQGGQKTKNHQLFLHSQRMQWSVNRQVVPGLCCPTVLSHNVPLNITSK